ncbi:hypothetical protein SAMN04515647_1980 [Cohaesibacter sp. ES.047]|uniref:hypothetical protein n=1 Tax=Cohaesibacter sp. ES.047 TaxID=1798205 RepID=UPI000BC0A25A|nr:hypothetical protein [Cohaesibacter sp. ES.047]SNY91740.1 hypothetical protein SAMN04515647_1980 [Cohaesibacter sp. ES.047]
MVHRYSVRPHLLDETAIREAIRRTGLQMHERGMITDELIENYTVDLDLLASTMRAMDSVPLEHARAA